jgi:hypothetical protein
MNGDLTVASLGINMKTKSPNLLLLDSKFGRHSMKPICGVELIRTSMRVCASHWKYKRAPLARALFLKRPDSTSVCSFQGAYKHY